MGLGAGAFGRRLPRGESPHEWSWRPLQKVRELASSLSALYHRESDGEMAIYKLGSVCSPDMGSAGTLTMDSQLPERCRTHFCCLNYLGSVALLSQPQGTKTSVRHIALVTLA